jgi:hypothetical protein
MKSQKVSDSYFSVEPKNAAERPALYIHNFTSEPQKLMLNARGFLE